MIFADASDGTWVAVAMSGVAIIGGAITLGINATKERRMVRDKLEFDNQIVELRAGNKACLEDRQVMTVKMIDLETNYKKCMEHHASSDEERGKIWAEIRALKSGV